MRAGRLRYSAELQENRPQADASGQMIAHWQTIARLPVGIEPLSGRELLAADAEHATRTHRVPCRYNKLVTVGHRLRIDDGLAGIHIYDINAVIDRNNRHRDVELMCTEVVL